MYYKSVNRGLTFTKPGLYSIMFVMAIGMLAIVSGVNGLYLFLSTGLAALIVSGLLSERTIKAFSVKKVEDGVFEAGKAQHVKLVVQNQSSKFYLNGVDAFVVTHQPRFRLLKRDPQAIMEVQVQRLEPGELLTVKAVSTPMERAYYRTFTVYYRTEYPFGLLEKFKITEVESNVIVAPQVDQSIYGDALEAMRDYVRRAEEEQEFYSHRSYMPRDSLKFVDWRRSANRPTSSWVVKRYVADHSINQVIVAMDWEFLRQSPNELAYEQRLTELYSVIKGVHHATGKSGFRLGLSFDELQVTWGFEAIVGLIADLPGCHLLPHHPNCGGEALPEEVLLVRVGECGFWMQTLGDSP